MGIYSGFAMRSTAIAVATALGGCALSSPYVRLPPEPDMCASDASCGDLEKAVGYSRDVRARYRDMLDMYAKLRSNSGATAITLGAVALGAALGDANPDVFTSLGVLGAATYGYSSWYGNAPREALFGQTIQALVCAEGATIKLRFPPSAQNQADELKPKAIAAIAELNAAAIELAGARAAALAYLAARQAYIDSLKTEGAKKAPRFDLNNIHTELDPPIRDSKAALDTVPAALAAMSDALAALDARERAADNAGYALVSAVDRIVAATDVEAQKTLPDPSAAFTIVSGLASTAGKFIPSADAVEALRNAAGGFGKPQAQVHLDKDARRDVDALLSRLFQAQQRFTAASSDLAGIAKRVVGLAALPSPDAVGAVDKCTLAGIGPLAATPSSVELAKGKAQTVSVDMQGGKTPYRVEWSGSAPTGVSITQPGFSDSRFVVVGATDSDAGSSKLKVTDGSGRLLEVAVNVK
jgi:hypothetical protein